MFIKYDENELLDLFEDEPILISSKESGMFIYSKQNSQGVKVVLSLSVYEKECCISLCLEDDVIFETSLKDVECLISNNGSLRIHQNESDKDYIIYFKPNLFIKAE